MAQAGGDKEQHRAVCVATLLTLQIISHLLLPHITAQLGLCAAGQGRFGKK